MFKPAAVLELPLAVPQAGSEPDRTLVELMAKYPCYAFVANQERTGARALFRGRWTWEAVSAYMTDQPTSVVMNDERAAGFVRFRLYTHDEGCPVCLAEIEIYFARGEGRTSFWCQAGELDGALAMAA